MISEASKVSGSRILPSSVLGRFGRQFGRGRRGLDTAVLLRLLPPFGWGATSLSESVGALVEMEGAKVPSSSLRVSEKPVILSEIGVVLTAAHRLARQVSISRFRFVLLTTGTGR